MDVRLNTTDLLDTTPDLRSRHRLSVVHYIHHQQPGQQPHSVEHRYCRDLEQEEQTYVRVFQATEEWKPLDTGWLERVGHLVLVNEEGRNPSKQLSPEEKLELSKRVVQLGVFIGEYKPGPGEEVLPYTWVTGFALVPPGESVNLTPANISQYRIRCAHDKARCTLTLVPN